MTIRRNPNRGNHQARDAFVGQAAADDTTRLHCFIPSALHHQIKLMALEGRNYIDGAGDRGPGELRRRTTALNPGEFTKVY